MHDSIHSTAMDIHTISTELSAPKTAALIYQNLRLVIVLSNSTESAIIGSGRNTACPNGWLRSSMWHDIFAVGAPVVEKIIRPIMVYVFLVALLRTFGKRELAQLNPFDLVVLLSLSNTVQNAIIGNDNSLTGGLIGAFTLLGVNYLVVRFLFRHRRLDQMFEGKPTVLIEHGHMRQEGAGQGVADARRADDRAAPAGVRQSGGRGTVRSGAGRNLLHPAQDAAGGRSRITPR